MSTKINTQVIVTETIICDVCHCEANYNKPLLSAGQLYLDDGQQINYGMNLCLNIYGKQVEHICPDCLRKVLDALRNVV